MRVVLTGSIHSIFPLYGFDSKLHEKCSGADTAQNLMGRIPIKFRGRVRAGAGFGAERWPPGAARCGRKNF